MTNNIRDTDWGKAVEYGRHVFGVFPLNEEQIVTGILAHQGEHFTSYVDDGSFKSYANWQQDYKATPLKDVLEAFVEEKEMHTTEMSIGSEYYEQKFIESAGMGGWRFEYERKRAFRRAVLHGDVELETVALFNRYGEVYCPKDEAENVREKYWEFVDENYQHRQSHYEVTTSKGEA